MPEMTAEQAAEWGKTLSFEKVWAALMENREQIRKLEENIERMSDKADRVTVNVGGLNRSMGELIETLVAARLWEKFEGYKLRRAYRRVPLYDENNRVRTDIGFPLRRNRTDRLCQSAFCFLRR
jgi:hypothetical protein